MENTHTHTHKSEHNYGNIQRDLTSGNFARGPIAFDPFALVHTPQFIGGSI